MALIRAMVGVEKWRTVFTQGGSQGYSMLANQSVNEVEGKFPCSFVFLLWNEFFPAIHVSTTRLWHMSWVLLGGIGDGAYHGVPQDENGQLGVLLLHEINMLQAVPDEDVEIWDNHTITLALPMANCRGKEEHTARSFEAGVTVKKGPGRNRPVGLFLS